MACHCSTTVHDLSFGCSTLSIWGGTASGTLKDFFWGVLHLVSLSDSVKTTTAGGVNCANGVGAKVVSLVLAAQIGAGIAPEAGTQRDSPIALGGKTTPELTNIKLG